MPGEKTEQPTPKRVRKAREQGKIAKSFELISAFVILCSTFLLLNFKWKDLISYAKYSFISCNISPLLIGAKRIFLELILLLCVPLVITVVITGGLQTGGVIAWKSLKMDGMRINPAGRIKHILSKKNAFEFLKIILKIVIFLSIYYLVVINISKEFHYFYRIHFHLLPEVFKVILKDFLKPVILIILLLGVFDYFYQRRALLKELMMTKEEVKEEFKQDEGNPEIKCRRRQLHQEISMHNLREAVKNASFVVINPVHIAVAIHYDSEKVNVPKVAAKGSDNMAKQIVQIAEENGIPVMRNVFLARALFRVEEGEEIPEELYQAVAELIIQFEKSRGNF